VVAPVRGKGGGLGGRESLFSGFEESNSTSATKMLNVIIQSLSSAHINTINMLYMSTRGEELLQEEKRYHR